MMTSAFFLSGRHRVVDVLDRFPFARLADHQHLHVAALKRLAVHRKPGRAWDQRDGGDLQRRVADDAQRVWGQALLDISHYRRQRRLGHLDDPGRLLVLECRPAERAEHAGLDQIRTLAMRVVVEAPDHHVVLGDELQFCRGHRSFSPRGRRSGPDGRRRWARA